MNRCPSRVRPSILAALLLAGAAGRGAAAISEATPAAAVHAPRVPWRADLSWSDAVASARAGGKPILIDFTASWCGPCRLLDVMVFTETPVIVALADVVTLKVDLDHPGTDDLSRRFDITSVPTLVWCGADGVELDRINGYVNSARFLEMVADWRAGVTIDAGLDRRLAARPESPVLLLESARRHRRAGREREAVVDLRRLLNLGAVADTATLEDARQELVELTAAPLAGGAP
jgi:thiol-disulfide isomerase/thioredoxin